MTHERASALWWTPAHVLQALAGTAGYPPGPPVPDIGIDSRTLAVGGLFVALPGTRHDGHDFVAHALEQGAALALVHREVPVQAPVWDLRSDPPRAFDAWPRPLLLRVPKTLKALQQLAWFWRRGLPHLRVVGVTGSVGKTTTKETIAQVLSAWQSTFKSPGNYNSEIGLPLSLVRARPYHRFAVLEMGFYVPGDIALLCDIAQPYVGVVTAIDWVHAERAGSLEEIVRGKAELVQALPEEGVAVLNVDDPHVARMAAWTRGRVVGYGFSPQAQVRALEVQVLGLEGVRFRVQAEGQTRWVRIGLLGRQAVYAALAAIAVARALGVPWEVILQALAHLRPRLRLRPFRGPQGAWVIDDAYNAAPRSTLAALDLLATLPGERIAVLGDMLELGPYEAEGHRRVGQRAAQVVHRLIAVGPRAARWLVPAAQQAGLPEEAITLAEDHEQAWRALRPLLHADAVVLIKASRSVGLDRLVQRLQQEVGA